MVSWNTRYKSYIDPFVVWYLYELTNEAKEPYYGITNSPKPPLREHERNRVQATADRGPWTLTGVWSVGDSVSALNARLLAYKLGPEKAIAEGQLSPPLTEFGLKIHNARHTK